LQRLGITEEQLLEAVARAQSDEDVAAWLREHTDASGYEKLSRTLAAIEPKHAGNPEVFRTIYAETLAAHPDLVRIVDIIDADDRRMFGTI